MDILLVLCLGICSGRKLNALKYAKYNERLQVLCVMLLVFSMGIKLGTRQSLIQELSSIGVQSFIFFSVPTALSIIGVYFTSKAWLSSNEREKR